MNHMNSAHACKCNHHKWVPGAIILLGIVFLLGNLGVLTSGFVGLIWPVLVIALGVAKLQGGSCKCYAHAS